MKHVRIDGDHVWVDSRYFPNLDDFEAFLIACHNEVLAARQVARSREHCPDPRCQRLAHPDHANGHLITGDTWPDAKQRRDARMADRP